MSEMVPFGGGLARRESRRVGRELARMDGQGQLELARINQQADLQAERVAAVGYVGKRAMHEVAMLSASSRFSCRPWCRRRCRGCRASAT